MSWKSREERFPLLLKPSGDCLVYIGKSDTGNGYGKFCHMLAHRYAYTLYYGSIPEDVDVLHTCDVRRCCRKEHLYLGTDVENSRDTVLRHRHPSGNSNWSRSHIKQVLRGPDQPNALFTADEVRMIRWAWNTGDMINTLAEQANVSRRTISDIVHRRTYKSVE